jgi:hypothetical protein
MVTVPTLPNIIGTKVKHDDLTFTASDPKKTRVTLDDYSIIVCENDPRIYISTLVNCMEIDGVKIPYYLQHTDLFINAQKIFRDCFGVEPDVLLASVYKKDFSKSSFLFANRRHIENALKGTDNICVFDLSNSDEPAKINRKVKEEIKKRKLKYIEIENQELTFTLPSRVFPVIGTYNDLRFDNNPNFNLIFGSFLHQEIYDSSKTEEKTSPLINQPKIEESDGAKNITSEDSNPLLWESCFDEKIRQLFKVGIPLYCIKKFDLHNPSYIVKMNKENVFLPGFEKFDPWNMSEFYESINRQAVTKFNETIVNLLLGYNRASYLTINIDAYIATMPHFYNLDRTPSSVEFNETLQVSLSRKYEQAYYFAKSISGLTMKHFIEFFIVESIIDFLDFFDDPAKELRRAMAEKDETSKLIGNREILSKFLNNDMPNTDYSRFLNGQMIAKKDISSWIP